MRRLTCFLTLLITAVPFPGTAQSYFQQEVNYTIKVRLDDKANVLRAEEQIEYINNSPDQLTFIYMHLWPNAYKNDQTALAKQLRENGETKFHFAPEHERGFIDSLDFRVNGQPVMMETDPEHIDICKLILNEPLRSGDRILITTPFRVKIPAAKFSRMGYVGQSYQITQWYPKPAVYDRNGWNQMPYLDQGEFYSEFGSFDVSITLPKNYVLAATGDMTNSPEEVEWLDRKAKETAAISRFPTTNAFPPSDTAMKTVRFVQAKVHDFAWFCDKRWNVLRSEVVVPKSQRTVTSWVMFTNANAELWRKGTTYVNDAIHYYSLWNGDYPYNHATAVDGTISAGGGMEYPNITVIGEVQSDFTLETVIMHEVGHNWFYGILASNERLHPWMDEGLNSFNENRYIETKYPNASLFGHRNIDVLDMGRYKHKAQYELTYLLAARKNEDQPIEAPAASYTPLNYAGIVYSKTAIAFDYLMAYLGQKIMDEAMRRYFETWKFKHPQPADLRRILEEVSGKDLSWFFNDMIGTTKKLDYKILSSSRRPDGSYDIWVKNTGDINGPVQICGVRNNQMVGVIFYDGFEGTQVLGFPPSEVDYFKIDFNEDMPETNRNNNRIRTSGMFKKIEPLRLQFLGSLDNPDRSQLFYMPVVGWNKYNGVMAGAAFYNNLLPQKKFEFQLMPLYSTNTQDLAGYGRIALNLCPPNKLIRQATLSFSAARFCYSTGPQPFNLNYNKFAPALDLEIKKRDPRSKLKQVIGGRYVYILRDNAIANIDFTPYIYTPVTDTIGITQLTYKLNNNRSLHPYSAKVDFQSGTGFSKIALEGKYRVSFKGRKKGLDIRLFAGKFLSGTAYSFKLSGPTGFQDYMYDEVFMGRNEAVGDNMLAQQFLETDGAFKAYSPYGRSSDWMAALNLKCTLPKVPVGVFADIGTWAEAGKQLKSGSVLYDSGLYLILAKDICEVYFPIAKSNEINDYYSANDFSYFQTVRFTLHLSMANPFKLINEFSL